MKNYRKLVIISALFGSMLCSCSVRAPKGIALFDFFAYEGSDAFYSDSPAEGEDIQHNPLFAGWYSDPSICAGPEGDYYMVFSSYSFFPAIPLLHSTDLVNWERAGSVLDRPSQVAGLDGQPVSAGFYAPDISYNPVDGMFYVATTDIAEGIFFVKSPDPLGDWSDPVFIEGVKGIDPSFFFNADGSAYLLFSGDAPGGKAQYSGHRTIRCVAFDTEEGKTAGEETILVDKGDHPEGKPTWIRGPHLYKEGDGYYLLCEQNGIPSSGLRSEVVFKGTSPSGPFKAYPGNPVLTQAGLDPSRPDRVEAAGHADMVKDASGQWWAVFNAVRPYKDLMSNIGSETYMLPVFWTDDAFPFMLPSGYQMPLAVRHEGTVRSEAGLPSGNFSWRDDFDSGELDGEWMTLRAPATDRVSLTGKAGFLRLDCDSSKASDAHTPSLVARRLGHHVFEASTRMYFTPDKHSAAAGMILFKDEMHQYFFKYGSGKVTLQKAERVLVVEKDKPNRFEDELHDIVSASIGKHRFIDLKTVSDGESFAFWYSVDGKQWQLLVDGVDASYLTSAVAGGFTGTLIGLYAVK